MTNPEKVSLKRLNITLTNSAVDDVELLRSLLEKRLIQRLSIAQVIKRLTFEALADEKAKALLANLNNS